MDGVFWCRKKYITRYVENVYFCQLKLNKSKVRTKYVLYGLVTWCRTWGDSHKFHSSARNKFNTKLLKHAYTTSIGVVVSAHVYLSTSMVFNPGIGIHTHPTPEFVHRCAPVHP